MINFSTNPSHIFGTYKTYGEVAFYHTSKEYDAGGHSLAAAFTRLSNKRFQDVPGLHEELIENQARSVHNPIFGRILQFYSESINFAFSDLGVDTEEALQTYAYTAHTKQKFRIFNHMKMYSEGLVHTLTWLLSAIGNVKPFEWAKMGKLPRLVVDLTCMGSLYAGWLVQTMKAVMHENTFDYESSRAQFVPKANLAPLREVFRTALSSHYLLEFFYHSDDAFLRVQMENGDVYFVETDISSCDTSHTICLLRAFEQLRPSGAVGEYFDKAIEQLFLPIILKNKEVRREKVTFDLQEGQFSLYSGSVFTTILNNLANLLIFSEIAMSDLRQCKNENEIVNSVRNSGARAGYKITIKCSKDIRHITFLKHSSTLEGEPWLNLGVMLRVLGCCRGDYPKVPYLPKILDTFEIRAYVYQCSLVKCFCHAGNSIITRALRAKYSFGRFTKRRTTGSYLLDSLDNGGEIECDVSDDDIMTRYGISQTELDEFMDFIESARGCCTIDSTVSRKIYALDYSIEYA